MNLGLRGARAVITGGSRGIGRTIARLLAQEGVDVAVFGRGADTLAEAKAEIESFEVRAYTEVVHGRRGDAVRGFVRRAAEAFGGIDLFVANLSAGGGTDSEPYWRRNFEIDLLSAVRALEEALPFLKQGRHPSVLILGSMAASETFVAPMAYNAIKAALIAWGKQLAIALAPHGIRVNILSPGPTLYPDSNWEMIRITYQRVFNAVLREHPLRRFATPEEVAQAAVFLLSPALGWCLGAHLLVDGGFSKRVPF